MNNKSLYKLTYGLFVVTVNNGVKNTGCVINTAIQVTSKPQRLALTISKDNYTHDVLAQSKVCTVSVLSENVPMNTIAAFGFQSGRDADKFANIPTGTAECGLPYLTEGTVAYFAGNIISSTDVGTHTIFIMELTEGEILSEEPPMTYAYYQQVKKGTSPKNAPSYQETTETKGWQCSICGHIEKTEELSADFTCPICKQGRDKFVKL